MPKKGAHWRKNPQHPALAQAGALGIGIAGTADNDLAVFLDDLEDGRRTKSFGKWQRLGSTLLAVEEAELGKARPYNLLAALLRQLYANEALNDLALREHPMMQMFSSPGTFTSTAWTPMTHGATEGK